MPPVHLISFNSRPLPDTDVPRNKILPFKSFNELRTLSPLKISLVHGFPFCNLLFFKPQDFATFLKKIFGGHKSFLWGHWYPCFGPVVMSTLGFKARGDPLLVCFLTCVQWIPQIHLWCDTCWPLYSQHGSQSHSLHAVAEVGCWDPHSKQTCYPLGHRDRQDFVTYPIVFIQRERQST